MDKLEELVQRWRGRANDLRRQEVSSRISGAFADSDIAHFRLTEVDKMLADLSALRGDYVLVPREPTQEDVERVDEAMTEAVQELDVDALSDEEFKQACRRVCRHVWAAIVGGTDEA